jgi:hypothetical protein
MMPADPHFHARMLLSRVPDEIRKSISTDELNDRLIEAARLGAQANDPSLSNELRRAAKLRGQAILQAQPARATKQQHAELIAKAAATSHRGQAEAIRREAEELISERHPIAPPHRGAAVRKAKADIAEMVPVFNQDGQLIGIADPADITPVRGSKPSPTPEENAQDAQAAENVAKATGMVAVYDAAGRPYLTYQRDIRKSAAQAGDLVTVQDSSGRSYRVPRSVLQSPEVQARNTGPVNAGGTTGMGQPRQTGPASSSPANGPQRALPGDVPDRTVIKALNPEWTAVYDYTGRLAGAVKTSSVIASPRPGTVAKSQIDDTHANVYDARRRKIGMAPLSHVIPVAELRKALGTTQPRRRPGR